MGSRMKSPENIHALIAAGENLMYALAHGSRDEIDSARGNMEVALNIGKTLHRRLLTRFPKTDIRETCFLPAADPHYTHPSPQEARLLVHILGWSDSQVAAFIGLNPDRSNGPRTVRRWMSGEVTAKVPYAVWRLLCQAADAC